MTKNSKNEISKLTFEDAIQNLTEIVAKIESGQTPLQSSIEQYEKGMELIKHCRGILQAAEKKIEKISAESTKQIDTDAENGEDKELF